MKYLIIDRHIFHKAPPAEDRYAALKACDDYGEISGPYKVYGSWVLATDDVNGYGVCEIDTPERLWDIERNYPGYEAEGGLEYELLSNVSGGDFYGQALSSLKAKQEKGLQ